MRFGLIDIPIRWDSSFAPSVKPAKSRSRERIRDKGLVDGSQGFHQALVGQQRRFAVAIDAWPNDPALAQSAGGKSGVGPFSPGRRR
jgi:hypothetical protein